MPLKSEICTVNPVMQTCPTAEILMSHCFACRLSGSRLLCFFTTQSCAHLTPPPFSTLCHLLPGSMFFPVQHITLHPCVNQGRNKEQRRRLAL